MKRIFFVFGILAIAASALVGRVSVRPNTMLVSAAASLTEAMQEIGTAYTRSHPSIRVQFNFAASGALQQQIEQGAPVDVFASASAKEMDALQSKGLLGGDSRTEFAGNRLVCVAPVGSKLKDWKDLAGASVKHVAISDPAFVPSGRYGKQTLERKALWNAVKPKAVLGENVRQTLSYVANGDAEAGIVFSTDLMIVKNRVKLVKEAVPGVDHDPIVYPVSVLRDAPNPAAARNFVKFLLSKEAQAILKRHGFTPPPSRGKRSV